LPHMAPHLTQAYLGDRFWGQIWSARGLEASRNALQGRAWPEHSLSSDAGTTIGSSAGQGIRFGMRARPQLNS
jgi:hypothetical protein